MFTDHKKEVEARIGKLRVAINAKNWKDLGPLVTKDFEFTAASGPGGKGVAGLQQFRARILALPDTWNDFHIKPSTIKKITAERYFVVAEMRLRIRTHAAGADNIVWITNQTWVKQKSGNGFVWKMQSLKEMTGKFGSQGQTHAAGPPLPN
jgi:hypothetical protein